MVASTTVHAFSTTQVIEEVCCSSGPVVIGDTTTLAGRRTGGPFYNPQRIKDFLNRPKVLGTLPLQNTCLNKHYHKKL